MNDERSNTDHTAEQWAAFQKIWGETFSKLMQLGFTFSPESAPPDFLRQMRSGLLQALSQSWEQFLRSPQFMEGTRQWMEQAMAFRKLSSEFFNKVRHETQTTTRDDIDSVMLAVRHMETRILERVEDLALQVTDLQARLNGSRESAAPAAPAGGNESPAAKKRASQTRTGRNPRRR